MTVRELIAELQHKDQDALVYVPLSEGANGLLKYVCRQPSLDAPTGIAISDDVALLPLEMEAFVHEREEDIA